MKTKRYFSLRISILTIFLTTFLLLMITLLVLMSINFFQTMSYVSKRLIANTTHLVMEELSLQLATPITLAKLSQRLLQKGIVEDNEVIDYELYVARNLPVMAHNHYVRRVLWGDPQGRAIMTALEPDQSYSTQVIEGQAANSPRYLIVRDSKHNVIGKKNLDLVFDPRVRPWYIEAKNSKEMTWTNIYYSYPWQDPHVALSTPIYDKKNEFKGVFAVIVNLVRLSNFLSTLDVGNGVAFIINENGQLVAFPGMDRSLYLKQHDSFKRVDIVERLGKPWVNTAFELRLSKGSHFSFEYHSEKYLASFEPIPEFSRYGWMIGVIVPEKDFTGSLKRTNRLISIIGLLILGLGVLAISYFSKRITNPIKELVIETEKIKQMVFDASAPVESRIKEVYQLATAISSMKVHLRSFEKYIPRKLVQQLIQTGEDSVKGGVERQLTVFFSDIKDFTSLSESMSSQDLMLYLSDYLEEMSKIITHFGGTIDKYIGDSIMAFWNAPLFDPLHAEHACVTALRAQKKLAELNEQWKRQGKTPLLMRIGIHSGPAIVGNIGSNERLNYTSLGDSVNLASRLENINKLYQTKIIVSEMVVRSTLEKNFAYRLIDRIKVRGKTVGYAIYELMAESADELSFDLANYTAIFERGFKAYEKQDWQAAILAFEECLLIYPEDTVAPVFIRRCEHFKRTPPPADWQGTWSETLII